MEPNDKGHLTCLRDACGPRCIADEPRCLVRLISEHPVELSDGAVLKLWHYRVAGGERDNFHVHGWAQLDWSPTGVLTVDVDDRSWVVPPTVAFWVPAARRHAVGASRAADLRHVTFYPRCDDRLSSAPFDDPVPVAMTPLMIELLNRLTEPSLDRGMRGRIGEVFVDTMTPATEATFELRLPRDERAAAIARHLLDDPADDRSLAEWGRVVGASRRTLVRLFRSETSLTFTEWRTRCRIRSALPRLSVGASVSEVAYSAGYENVSAFVVAFRRTTGVTPGDYRRQVSPDARQAAPR